MKLHLDTGTGWTAYEFPGEYTFPVNFPDEMGNASGAPIKYVGSSYVVRGPESFTSEIRHAADVLGTWVATDIAPSIADGNAAMMMFEVVGAVACAVFRDVSKSFEDADYITVYTASVTNLSLWTRRGTTRNFGWPLGRVGDALLADNNDGTNTILRSTDGGMTWNTVAVPSNNFGERLFEFYGTIPSGFGIIREIEAPSRLLLTTDSGATWGQVNYTASSTDPIFRASNGHLFSYSNVTTVHRSTDNGASFTDVTPVPAPAEPITSFEEGNGYIIGIANDAYYRMALSGGVRFEVVTLPDYAYPDATENNLDLSFSPADARFYLITISRKTDLETGAQLGSSSKIYSTSDFASFSDTGYTAVDTKVPSVATVVPDLVSDFISQAFG